MFSSMKIWEYVAGAAVIAAFAGFMYYKGYSPEHDKLVSFQSQIAEAGVVQKQEVDNLNKQREGDSQNADERAAFVAKSIDDYYHNNPIRMLNGSTCTSPVPKAADGAQGPDGSAPKLYASPYPPDQVEKEIAKLKQLQDLLLKEGVTVG